MKKCLFFLSFIIFACEPTICLEREDFYFGLDGQIRNMGYKKGFGDLVIRKSHPQYNVYLGYKINENIWLEIGEESTQTKVKHSNVVTGQRVTGNLLPRDLSPALFKTKIKVRGPHLDLVFSKRILNDTPLSAIGSVGLSQLTIIYERNLIAAGIPPCALGMEKTLKKKSVALRAMGGIQYTFDNGMGLRVSLNFVNTGNMVVKVKDSDSRKFLIEPRVRPKDSLSAGIGLVVPF